MARLSAILLLVISIVSQIQAGEESAGTKSKHLGFAEYLFAEGDYYRAITEYKRFLYENPGYKNAFWIKYRIGQSYLQGEQLQAALLVFSGLMNQDLGHDRQAWAGLAAARVFYLQGRLRQALEILEGLDLKDDPRLLGYKHYLSGCVWLRLGEKENADLFLQKLVSENHQLSQQADILLHDLGRINDIDQKSPVAAGLLSIVPGMGHVYIGEYAIALTAFSWNGLFAFATWDAFHQRQIGVGVLLSVLELLWYSGTIYGAISGANRYNRDARRLYLEQTDQDAGGLDIPFPGNDEVYEKMRY